MMSFVIELKMSKTLSLMTLLFYPRFVILALIEIIGRSPYLVYILNIYDLKSVIRTLKSLIKYKGGRKCTDKKINMKAH